MVSHVLIPFYNVHIDWGIYRFMNLLIYLINGINFNAADPLSKGCDNSGGYQGLDIAVEEYFYCRGNAAVVMQDGQNQFFDNEGNHKEDIFVASSNIVIVVCYHCL